MSLRDAIFNTLWYCDFAEHEDPAMIEKMKTEWPEDVVSIQKRADAALATFREWLEAEGLVVVPRDPNQAMLDALSAQAQRITIDPEDDQAWKATAFNGLSLYRAMIAAAPDAMGEK